MVVDIFNGKDGPHSPENAVDRQTKLLDILDWFSKWKALHDKLVTEEETTEYNCVTNETWFCLHVTFGTY